MAINPRAIRRDVRARRLDGTVHKGLDDPPQPARCGHRGDANARRRAVIHGRDDRFRYDIGDSALSEKHKSALYADDPHGLTRQILRDTGSG